VPDRERLIEMAHSDKSLGSVTKLESKGGNCPVAQTNCTTEFERMIRLDRIFVKAEKRGLHFLLTGESKEKYLDFLMKPVMYRDYIRALEANDDWVK
jgi:hypothetical protein